MADAVSLKANIPVHELKLTNGDICVFYDYITTGESREIQRLLLEGGKFNSTTGQIEDLSVSSFLTIQDKSASYVIKEVKPKEGEPKPFDQEWLNSLPADMGNEVYEEVNKVTQVSSLTQEQKKG